jgi:hypothetical protein
MARKFYLRFRVRIPEMITNRLATMFLAAAVTAATPAAPTRSSLPWIEDDYGRALSEARTKKLPIFVDAWAPW